ncbi:hypothetical protein Zmor_023146 [Zophobas morio]|uniref:Uncharacterized protein n=1 Tax=Zophobas morio TaxID=2755281 RepID=A0AA38HXJ5_9CUCU|nr:hypothetical protein Zmor_023146 [Zophobas morio]
MLDAVASLVTLRQLSVAARNLTEIAGQKFPDFSPVPGPQLGGCSLIFADREPSFVDCAVSPTMTLRKQKTHTPLSARLLVPKNILVMWSYRRDPEPFDSGESTLSELDESESGSGSGIEVDPNLPYPGIAPIALRYLSQTTRPRSWCLALISNPYPLHMHTFFTCLQGKVGIVEGRNVAV